MFTITQESKIRLLEAMKRAVNNRNELRLQDHVARMHELNLRLAKQIGLETIR
jgi:hypothetical protein